MTDKNQIIVNAAANMFGRYGFSKTTMGDIATEAGVARQTVYNAFPGKEEILRAVVRHIGEETFVSVMASWANAKTIDEKLSAFHDDGPLKWFEMICAAPDWADLMDGLHKAASEELTVLDNKWHAAIIDTVRTDMPNTSANPEDIADFFYATSLNAKHGVKDIAQLRARLATIKAATLALLKA